MEWHRAGAIAPSQIQELIVRHGIGGALARLLLSSFPLLALLIAVVVSWQLVPAHRAAVVVLQPGRKAGRVEDVVPAAGHRLHLLPGCQRLPAAATSAQTQ